MLAPEWMKNAKFPFGCVLIANRGEVACRIAKACKELELSTVAIYTSSDENSPLLDLCDQNYFLEGDTLHETFLNVQAIITAAKETGAQAIHPGFGFLSESAEFAKAVNDAGLIWVGPSPEAIEIMGDKMSAREKMKSVGVPLVPGHEVYSTNMKEIHDELIEVSPKLGFPLLLKASAGGGGKGMRVVNRPSELAEAIGAAQREAQTAFGDGRIYVEKLLTKCRHIEIQILADGYGNIIHLGERECSLQRRHQKVIEECPSPVMEPRLRNLMGAAGIAAAAAVTYMGAGTVEFLLDGDKFYFLEMNTRLQVEHPVTEFVTGIDIVHQQFRIAAGLPLEIEQKEITMKGHSIESRVYAEDPSSGFLPSAGPLLRLKMPQGPGIRVDSGVIEGNSIDTNFDPMIAKIIVHANDRETAIMRMKNALKETVLLGLQTNIEFLHALLCDEDVINGDTDTNLIETKWPKGWNPPEDPEFLALGAIACAIYEENGLSSTYQSNDNKKVNNDPFSKLNNKFP
ncbi:MAG: biotin carboxylase N-terminal domain-containing protein [Candidatus Thermoplasmatota archaeon]|nr:biotin carboxylase N-terminal domain-containing protein [Candidatus Thermoplasmatota archaeon]